jgi:hypothetical protein
MDTLELAKHAKDIGLVGIEGIDSKLLPGREEARARHLARGQPRLQQRPLQSQIPRRGGHQAHRFHQPGRRCRRKKVITFTGMKFEGMDRDKAINDCLDTWKEVLPHAEKKGITLVLEHLNSRDSSHPMKGHPGYFGDDVDFCVDLIKQIGSPNFKLLFDIYHVSIMNGDIIRRLRLHKDYIGHLHTAGIPAAASWTSTRRSTTPPSCRPSWKSATTTSSPTSSSPPGTIPSSPCVMRRWCVMCDTPQTRNHDIRKTKLPEAPWDQSRSSPPDEIRVINSVETISSTSAYFIVSLRSPQS